jgi:polyketide synthase PksN
LKHKQLVPSIHFQQPNEHFDFEDSPLYVNTETKAWSSTESQPRRACISSFGYSGTNAHLVIEEYRPQPSTTNPTHVANTIFRDSVLFVLSAQSEPQLQTYAQLLRNWLNTHASCSLEDLAYTLQVGRRSLDYRLAFVANSREEVNQALTKFITGQPTDGTFTAQVKRNKHGIGIFEADEDAQSLLHTWMQQKNLHKLAEAWVAGLDIDWPQIYTHHKPQRINLPTYPFAQERYWLPDKNLSVTSNKQPLTTQQTALHPILHRDRSNLAEQIFSSTFTGEEFFLTNHVVEDVRVLPGVAYLEMACEAFVQFAGSLYSPQPHSQILLQNIGWHNVLKVADHPYTVYLRLSKQSANDVAYEIYRQSEEGTTERLVYSQGHIILAQGMVAPTLNLEALQALCNQHSYSATECYEIFRSMGIVYGPDLQGIEKIFTSPGHALAKIMLPASVANTYGHYLLHPTLLDAIFQTTLGLHIGKHDNTPALPFALDELAVFKPSGPNLWAWVRYSDGDRHRSSSQKLDIDVCDEHGTICLRIKGFSTRTRSKQAESTGTLMLHPHWQEQPATGETSTPHYTERRIIFLETEIPSL